MINLESVGTGIDTDGMTYLMFEDGGYDYGNGIHISDIEPDGDWFNSLSVDDSALLTTLQKYHRPRQSQSCAGCGGRAEMSASLGPSCPDCYDSLSG